MIGNSTFYSTGVELASWQYYDLTEDLGPLLFKTSVLLWLTKKSKPIFFHITIAASKISRKSRYHSYLLNITQQFSYYPSCE